MRVLVAPAPFTGTLCAAEAAAAIERGWLDTSPTDDLSCRPMSDGGLGFLDAIAAGLGGERVRTTVAGLLGNPVPGEILLTHHAPEAALSGSAPDGTTTAWVDSAMAVGRHLLPPAHPDPTATTTAGVGELIELAVSSGASRVVVGVGATGTADAGAGMLAALGATASGTDLTAGGGALVHLSALDLSRARTRLSGVRLQLATDIDVPLLGPRGAARTSAHEQGASPDQEVQLEAGLGHLADLIGALPNGRHPERSLGAGAGGGLGYGLLALGATRVPGLQTVLAATGFDEEVAAADLVITGEGSLDWRSDAGKVVATVAGAAGAHAVPTIVLAGRVELPRPAWMALGVAGAYGAVAPAASTPSPQEASVALRELAARVARTWSRPQR